ncbi:MAG: translation initiation factor [Flavobacteriales bacterium]|nr:translation initiation factor [Flavobacteriales bacterium]MCB9192596.1 translation initiation factor [Flavobacteriales bacterium]
MGKNKPQTHKGLESLGSLFNVEPSEEQEPDQDFEETDEIEAGNFDLRVQLDKRSRNGKAVTLVTGFGDLHPDDIDDLAKMLKSKCGVGGGAKNGEILIQGDHVNKVMDLLKKEGFKVKRSGG